LLPRLGLDHGRGVKASAETEVDQSIKATLNQSLLVGLAAFFIFLGVRWHSQARRRQSTPSKAMPQCALTQRGILPQPQPPQGRVTPVDYPDRVIRPAAQKEKDFIFMGQVSVP